MTLFVSVPTRFTGTGCMDGGGPVSLIPQTQGTVYGHVSADPGCIFPEGGKAELGPVSGGSAAAGRFCRILPGSLVPDTAGGGVWRRIGSALGLSISAFSMCLVYGVYGILTFFRQKKARHHGKNIEYGSVAAKDF